MLTPRTSPRHLEQSHLILTQYTHPSPSHSTLIPHPHTVCSLLTLTQYTHSSPSHGTLTPHPHTVHSFLTLTQYTHPSPSPLQANEFILLNQKLTAQEAFDRNLVTRVFPASEFDSKVEELVKYMAQLPPQVQHTTCVCCFTSFL